MQKLFGRECNNVEDTTMPSYVRAFWWISVAIVTYWAVVTAWQLVFPTAHYLAVLSKLPADLQEATRRTDMLNRIVGALAVCSVTLGLAWLAAFRRLNWARWGFVIFFLAREAIPLIIAIAYHQLDAYFAEFARQNWADPIIYVVPILTVVAIVFVFSGNAQSWFKRVKASEL